MFLVNQILRKKIAQYVQERINECNLGDFYSQGFEIGFGDPEAKVTIDSGKVTVNVNQRINIIKGDSSASKSEHKVEVVSKFGKLYDTAKQVYTKEMESAFLENYSEDVLRMYAPVDGVELGCSPKIWKTREVIDGLKNALEANVAAVKMKGDYYSLNDKKDEYFVVNSKVDEAVRFMYSKEWPGRFEIYGDGVSNEMMIANVVGNQPGLGAMGFCYAPYHFVYDMRFPVMVQVYDSTEIFQFPIVVIIDKNVPRKAAVVQLEEEESLDVCEYADQNIEVKVYDTNLNFVNGNTSVYYQCFDEQCKVGETKNGYLTGRVPTCVNGQLIVKSDGYSEGKQIFSSNRESGAEVIMDREYNLDVDLIVSGGKSNGIAVVLFNGNKVYSTALPEGNKMKLSEGLYNVSVYVYDNSSIIIPGTTKTECYEVPRQGLLAFFGSTREECTNIQIPETKIEQALSGGGQSELYVFSNDLEKGKMTINVGALPKPISLERLQYNFELFDKQGVDLQFG